MTGPGSRFSGRPVRAVVARGQAGQATVERVARGKAGQATVERVARGQAGQATVELVALLPLLAVAGLAAGQLLAAGAARELAGNAAEAGAVAMLQGRDPLQAARAALPGWSRDRAVLRVDGRRVRVRLVPRTVVPGLASRLVATAGADAGPLP
jgi:hypothetical protein